MVLEREGVTNLLCPRPYCGGRLIYYPPEYADDPDLCCFLCSRWFHSTEVSSQKHQLSRVSESSSLALTMSTRGA
jgi:hypothetical protein